MSYGEQLRDQSIRLPVERLEQAAEIIQAVVAELKIAEDQLEKHAPLLADLRSLREAAHLAESAPLWENHLEGLLERCHALQSLHARPLELEDLSTRIQSLETPLKELEEAPQKLEGVGDIKSFTQETLAELDAILQQIPQ